jgi:hypothetical protein
MYIVTSYWIEGDMGETIKTKEFKSATEAEYYNKENKLNHICTYSGIRRVVPEVAPLAKVDCTYCNA